MKNISVLLLFLCLYLNLSFGYSYQNNKKANGDTIIKRTIHVPDKNNPKKLIPIVIEQRINKDTLLKILLEDKAKEKQPKKVYLDSVRLFDEKGNWRWRVDSIDPLFMAARKAKEAAQKGISDRIIKSKEDEIEKQKELQKLKDAQIEVEKKNFALKERELDFQKKLQKTKDLEIKAQKIISFRQTENLEQQKYIRNIFIFGSFVLGMLLIIISRSLIQNKRAKKIITEQKENVENQKKILEHQKQEILDSIEYAKRIQTAILPPPRIVKEFLKNSFILYLPKDIVAGDFYWMESVDDKIYFAACDCTGHGVPGAMVSVVCNTALSRSLNEFGLRNTGEIFDQTRALVLDNFAKSDEEVQDGMDASLAALDVTTRKLMWSGANNPLWIYRTADKTIQEIKADKQPIGKGHNNTPFSSHELSLYEGDIIYLFTDGYADQFGGEKGKKLTKAKFREKLLSIATLPMEEQRKELLDFHDRYRGSLAQVDDICVIGVRV